MKQKLDQLLPKPKFALLSKYRRATQLGVVVVVGFIGAYLIIFSHAQSPFASANASLGSTNGSASTAACIANTNDTCVTFNATASIASPTNLQVIDTSTTEVSLIWSPPSNWTPTTNNLTGYNVYRNGILINNISPTTKAFTTNYLDTGLTPGTTYKYSVSAVSANGSSALTSAVSTSTGQVTTLISSCQPPGVDGLSPNPLTKSGNYVITANLTENNAYPCLSFSDASHVNIDCQGNTITSTSAGGGSPSFSFSNDNNSMVVNCNFVNLISSPVIIAAAVQADGSNEATFDNNVFGNQTTLNNEASSGIQSQGSSSSVINNNTLYFGNIDLGNDFNDQPVSNSQITNNTNVACSSTAKVGCHIGLFGSNDVIAYNSINGSGGITGPSMPGVSSLYSTDDAINLDGDYSGVTLSGNIVDYNTLQNVYDCGIETTGTNINSDISNNTISNAGHCGIGAWYWSSWEGNTVDNNSATNAGLMFDFEYHGDSAILIPPGVSTIYFKNNTFNGDNYSLGSSYYYNLSYFGDWSVFDPSLDVPPAQMSLGNNIVENSNLVGVLTGRNPSNPSVIPGTITDGGGNTWCPGLSSGLNESPGCSDSGNSNSDENSTKNLPSESSPAYDQGN